MNMNAEHHNNDRSLSDTIVSYENLPLVLSVDQLKDVLRIGKNAAYELVNSGQIRCNRIGKTIRIPQSALREYLDGAARATLSA